MKKINSWKFGDTNIEAETLVKLVISGKKRATSSLYDAYVDKGNPLPKVGDKNIIVDSKNVKRCLIVIKRVMIKPFDKITKSFAFKEGEGNQSLDYWRRAHKRFFTKRLMKMKIKFSNKTLIVCEEFKVLKVFD